MNFEDEPYVRIYQRDTKTWLRWCWEGQTVFVLTSRKLDRAGMLDDITDPVADVALITGLPPEVVSVGLERVLASGTFEIRGGRLIAPRYVEAQTATKSDKLRSSELRKRRRDLARSGAGETLPEQEVGPIDARAKSVTREPDIADRVTVPSRLVSPPPPPVSDPSRGITERHAPSHAVTPSLAYPSLADPNGSPLPPESGGAAQTHSTSEPQRGKRRKPSAAKTACPLDLKPDPTTADLAWELGFTDQHRDAETSKCIDWAKSKAIVRSDWQATLRNWLRKSAEDRGLSPRKPRDAKWAAYQHDLRKANEPVKNPVPPPAGFNAALGGLFSG